MARRASRTRSGATSAKATSIQTAPQAPVTAPPSEFPPLGSRVTATQVSLWQGQFPPPEAIQIYEQVLPGAFDRLITMAEKQQAAVISSGEVAMSLQQKDVRRGQMLGAIVALACIGAAVYTAYLGHPGVAGALVAVPIMAVPLALISGARMRSEEANKQAAPNKTKKKK